MCHELSGDESIANWIVFMSCMYYCGNQGYGQCTMIKMYCKIPEEVFKTNAKHGPNNRCNQNLKKKMVQSCFLISPWSD